MKMIKHFSFLLITTIVIASCSSNKPTVDYRTDYNFSNLKSFAILPVDQSVYDNPKISEIEINRITQLMGAELSKRFNQVDKDQADFLVRYFLVLEERMRVDTYNASFGMYRGGYGYHYGVQSPQVKNTYYEHGSIIVDILDANSQDVVWRGSTEGRVSKNPTPQERDEKISRHLNELFSKFPPAQ